jgi:competence protein ComEA
VPALRLTRKQAVALAAAALALVLLAGRFFGGSETSSVSVEGAGAPSSRAVTPVVAAQRAPALVVDVAGAVRRPGVYRLARGSRIADAISRAGGPTRVADTPSVNLAAPLVDGQQVLMPTRAGPQSVAATSSAGAADASAHPPPVDLNTATAEQLDALPGVGPVTAQKIIAYRQTHGPFTSLAALDAIPGIGPARIASLRGLVVQR